MVLQKRRNVVHQFNGGLHADSAIFTFNWVAPTTNIGNIIFYFAGIAANNNGSENNDYAYHSSRVVTPASATGILEQNKSISEFKSSIMKAELPLNFNQQLPINLALIYTI